MYSAEIQCSILKIKKCCCRKFQTKSVLESFSVRAVSYKWREGMSTEAEKEKLSSLPTNKHHHDLNVKVPRYACT